MHIPHLRRAGCVREASEYRRESQRCYTCMRSAGTALAFRRFAGETPALLRVQANVDERRPTVRTVFAIVCASLLVLCSCQSAPDGVVNKVLVDFGLREKPEGYVSGGEEVFERLNAVGETELQRINTAARGGEVKFQAESGLRGKYYKEVRVYETFYPLDVKPVAKGHEVERGYVGYIQYAYRVYQSPPKSTRAAAASDRASIVTNETGRETYRYTFNGNGQWNGAKGERTRD